MDSNTERDSQLKSDWEAGVGAGVGGVGPPGQGSTYSPIRLQGRQRRGGLPLLPAVICFVEGLHDEHDLQKP